MAGSVRFGDVHIRHMIPTHHSNNNDGGVEYFDTERSLHSVSRFQLVISATSLVSCVALIALKFVNPGGIGQARVGAPLLSFGVGFLLQNAIQMALPYAVGNTEKSFIADYAAPIFLTLSQMYNNLPQPTTGEREAFFFPMTALAGCALAAYIHSLAARRRIQSAPMEPLLDAYSKKLSLFALSGSERRIILGVGLSVVSLATAIFAPKTLQGDFFREFSTVVLGYGSAHLIGELWLHTARNSQEKIKRQNQRRTAAAAIRGQRSEVSPIKKSPKLRRYLVFAKVVYNLGHVAPGALMLLGCTAKSGGFTAWAYTSYVVTGLLAGFYRHMAYARFTDVPYKFLSEIKPHRQSLSSGDKVFKCLKWTYAVPIVGSFLILAMANLNVRTGQFQKPKPIDIGALLSFGVFLYGSYALAHVAKKWFKLPTEGTSTREAFAAQAPMRSAQEGILRDPDASAADRRDIEEERNQARQVVQVTSGSLGSQSWKNSLYFYTHYHPGVPLTMLYLFSKMQIGDEALAHDGVLAGVAACVAYAQMGAYVGNEAYVNSEFPKPRIFSALTAALLGKFIIAQLAGKI